jgi:glutamate dehydrogenase (NAD(P)+)
LIHNGTLTGFPRASEDTLLNSESYLERECDILIPSALGRSINRLNADKLKCKLIIEGANGPTTFAAEEILQSRGITIIPDILINAGGITVSYFEWLKTLSMSLVYKKY